MTSNAEVLSLCECEVMGFIALDEILGFFFGGVVSVPF